MSIGVYKLHILFSKLSTCGYVGSDGSSITRVDGGNYRKEGMVGRTEVWGRGPSVLNESQ